MQFLSELGGIGKLVVTFLLFALFITCGTLVYSSVFFTNPQSNIYNQINKKLVKNGII